MNPNDAEYLVRRVMPLIDKIESHLSRLAAAAESPFWRLSPGESVFLFKRDGVWYADTSGSEENGRILGSGPTPQAAVEAFDKAFKGGK